MPWPKPDLMIAEVIGSPIAHTKSPELHRKWIGELGLNATFGAHEVTPSELAHWLNQRRIGRSWRGCSVTAPLKQLAWNLVDELSIEARRIGAVNLICNDGRKLKGYNTDLEGIAYAVTPHVQHYGKVVIAGAGGATLAALAYAIDHGFEDINVIARDPSRTFDKLASRFAEAFTIVPCECAADAINGANLLINATPMGSNHGPPMRPDILAALCNAAPKAAVLDMNYTPAETELLRYATKCGLTPISGSKMLVGQGRRAFELLFGRTTPE